VPNRPPELCVVSDVAIKSSALQPETVAALSLELFKDRRVKRLPPKEYLACDRSLERPKCRRQAAVGPRPHKQVDMLRHHDPRIQREVELASHPCKRRHHQI